MVTRWSEPPPGVPADDGLWGLWGLWATPEGEAWRRGRAANQEVMRRAAAGTLGDGMDHFPAQLAAAYRRDKARHARPAQPWVWTRRAKWLAAGLVVLACLAVLAAAFVVGQQLQHGRLCDQGVLPAARCR
jgi:hypothetical protein